MTRNRRKVFIDRRRVKVQSHTKSFQNYVSRGLIKMYPKTTVYMQDIVCFCGHAGKLQMDLRWNSAAYFVIHFREEGGTWTNHNSKYVKSHYIGNKFSLGPV